MKIDFLSSLAVFAGGGLGCLVRYFIVCLASRFQPFLFPYHTFFVNITSCFIIGLAFSVLVLKFDVGQNVKLFVMAGFCGGLSTFSALSLEVINLFQSEHYFVALTYAVLTLIFCVFATALGMLAGGLIVKNV